VDAKKGGLRPAFFLPVPSLLVLGRSEVEAPPFRIVPVGLPRQVWDGNVPQHH
jgi:hypothetical protein